VYVRPAISDDVPAILAIYNEAVLTTTASADIAAESLENRTDWFHTLTTTGFPVVVAEEEGCVLGWGSLKPYNPRPGYRFTTENSVYIAEAARGRGVGKVILADLLRRAGELPVRSVIAGISGDNEASLRLHRSFGFKDAGTLEGLVFKFDQWIDVVYLRYEVPGWESRCR
jgi:phosphinothricin acetyltransferase